MKLTGIGLRPLTGILLLLSLSTVWSGCEGMFDEPRRNIICFVDLSGSISPAHKNAYLSAIRYTLNSMGPNDRLTVYPIDEGSYTSPVKIMNEDFLYAEGGMNITFPQIADSLKPPFSRKGDGISKKEQKRKARVERYVDAISPLIDSKLDSIYADRTGLSSFTNILWATMNCREDLETLDPEEVDQIQLSTRIVPKNYIIFLSDMIHESKTYSFNMENGVDEEEQERILNELKSNGRVPDLKGANIIVLGKGPGTKVQSEVAIDNIEHFWKRYFSPEYANGRLYMYRGTDKIDEIPRFLENWIE